MQFAPLALIFLLIIVVFVLLVWLIPVRLWIAAWSSGARVGFGELIGMRLRRVSPGAVVNPRIAAVKAGLDAPTNILESHYLAGGNVDRVVNSLISADKAGIALDFSQAAAIDLAGRDVLDAVQTSVNPRVITTPKITAVAKDGIQLLVVTRITVRSNIDRLVGGATEDEGGTGFHGGRGAIARGRGEVECTGADGGRARVIDSSGQNSVPSELQPRTKPFSFAY